MRGCIPQLNWLGTGGKNASMGRTPRPFFSVRLKNLGHIGVTFGDLIGGTITMAQFGSLGLPWGISTTLLYAAPEIGWTYIFNRGEKTFTVTDSGGVVTVHSDIKTFSDLGISWAVFESPQFKIVLNSKFETEVFLSAWKYRNGQIPPGQENPYPEGIPQKMGRPDPWFWSLVDSYLNATGGHADYERLFDLELIEPLKSAAVPTIDASGLARTVLFAAVNDLSADCLFPSNLFTGVNAAVCARTMLNKAAKKAVIGDWMMIAAFASIMNASKPVLEPYMLWKLWQWVATGKVIIKRDRCFDLSPWWG